MAGKTRKFNGKAYRRTNLFVKKSTAKVAAGAIRKRGWLVRVVPGPKGMWVVYRRRKR